jgi:hypothetical protein
MCCIAFIEDSHGEKLVSCLKLQVRIHNVGVTAGRFVASHALSAVIVNGPQDG